MASSWPPVSMNSLGKGLEKDCCGRRQAGANEAAARAVRLLATMESSPLLPKQVAVLVSGSLLMCSWRFLSERLHSYETRGLTSLLEVWMVVAASFGMGQIARVMARSSAGSDGFDYHAAMQQQADASSSSSKGADLYPAAKEGLETGKVVEPAEAQGEDEDDVGVQKRIAQAEAAAKLAKYQDGLRQLLSSIGKSGSIADDAQLMHKLADQLFGPRMNLCELVSQGGVTVMMNAATSVLQSLTAQPNRTDVLPALLQLSWVLLQVAHGPPACCAALVSEDVAHTLLEVTRGVMAAPAVQPEAKECILRNLTWILLVLCDSSSSGAKAAAQAGPAKAAAAGAASLSCAEALLRSGATELLQQLVSLQFGVGPGWVAAASLGLFMQLGQQQQQQQDDYAAAPHAMVQAAVAAMLQPDSLHGVGYLLNHQPQLSDRLKGLVHGQLHYLLSFHTEELLQLLVEERLVGSFATGASPQLGRLLVCQLLSSRGQEVLAGIEASYEVDAALALAQIIPLPVHLKLPAAPGQQQQQQPGGEIHPEIEPEIEPAEAGGDAAAAAVMHAAAAPVDVVDDVYTDILACRLLLQHNRLDELLTAFCEELLAVQQQQGCSAAAAAEQAEEIAAAAAAGSSSSSNMSCSPVLDAVLKLVRHLMSRDLELQAVQHVRGDSVDDSFSSLSSSTGSVIDTALAMPDETGVYSAVMTGLVPQEQLPAAAAAAGASDAGVQQRRSSCSGSCGGLLTLPRLPGDAEGTQPCTCGNDGSLPAGGKHVVFQFGELQHVVTRSMYKKIKHSSKLVRSILARQAAEPGQGVTLFTTPHFTHEANCWVLQCLERWLASGALQGFTATQAAKLWVAADFLQVDGLQVACEDVLVAAAAEDASQLEVSLELCARHRGSSNRLQRLVAQVVMRGLDGGAAGVQQLRKLMARHRAALLPSLHAEVRDRLVTLCMLNAGLDDDTPEDMVE